MAKFIEITEGTSKVCLNVEWIKAVFKIENKTAIIVGDGYFNQTNLEDQVERYLANESYEIIVTLLHGAR